ncbi:MAG: leucine-rich repeat protein [Clostridiales bacterium]|nr:leucine-rich repeat protein [Candidatus Coliplasma equi]
MKSVIFEEEYELDENGKETDKLITNCKSIGKCAFAKCESLDTFRINRVDAFGVSIPASVTEIGEGAFLECASIPALALNDELLSIGNQAFYKCEKIMSVRFPATKNLTNETIGEYIFSTSIKPVLLKTCAGTVFE